MKRVSCQVYLTPEEVEKIDRQRGLATRSAYVRSLVLLGMSELAVNEMTDLENALQKLAQPTLYEVDESHEPDRPAIRQIRLT